jgi:alpha-tubulin suppressor-like RCC1 family protein
MRITTLRQLSTGGHSKAFALPTVLIASTVMLIILTFTLTSVQSGISSALDSSHYNRYAKTAAQSGLVMAKACLRANNYVASWSSDPLKPNTNCSGVTQFNTSLYIHNDTTGSGENVRSTFVVEPPTTLANGVQRLTIKGTAERVRSSGAVWRTYSETTYAAVSVQASFSSVAFGYQGTSGAYFGVIDPQGNVTAVGFNNRGQLGNGTTSNSSTPQSFQLPSTVRAAQLFTSFLSVGFDMFAITTDGQLYGAGANSYGQLGNGSSATAQSTPVKFNLPAGVQARHVSSGQQYNLVIGSDNNIYSAGACAWGTLGYGYTINGCSDQSSYRRVSLPTPNVADPNTLPVSTSDWVQTTNLATDRNTAYVRMQGGNVYGWGANDYGQLGTGDTTSYSTGVQVSTLGNSGQPKATQVATDGISYWILDDTGDVWSGGMNTYGSLGRATNIRAPSYKCIDNPSNSTTNGTQISINLCNDTAAQQLEWGEDGSLLFRPNSTTTKCLENANGSSTNNNPIRINTCNTASTAQKWTMNDTGKIVNPATGKCMEIPSNSSTNGTGIVLNACSGTDGYAPQTWALRNSTVPAKVVLPAGHGKVTRITTDQETVLFLMTDGTVWGYGLGNSGQLGSGSTNLYNPRIQQFILPSGRTAVNLYTTKAGSATSNTTGNTFVILDDGSVYGAGANTYGQLGNGSTSASPISTPVKMNLPAGIRAQTIQSGIGTTVILTDEGKIYTVGNNANGQLGDGSTVNSSTPLARQYVNNRPIVLY